jgi:hypothetical protein
VPSAAKAGLFFNRLRTGCEARTLQKSEFFRSLFSPYINAAISTGLYRLRKTHFAEGYGLQAVHKCFPIILALAAEGSSALRNLTPRRALFVLCLERTVGVEGLVVKFLQEIGSLSQ